MASGDDGFPSEQTLHDVDAADAGGAVTAFAAWQLAHLVPDDARPALPAASP